MAEDSKKILLDKIRKYNFAAYDLLLYLDTHPNDKKAFRLYQELSLNLKKLFKEYEQTYEPLSQFGNAIKDEFMWHKSPWPWEAENSVRNTPTKRSVQNNV